MNWKTALAASAAMFALTVGQAYAQTNTQTQQSTDTQSSTLETVVVTGIRASYEKALQIKMDSTQVVDAIVAQDIGKLPDNNVVEALQRVTGVQVTNRGGGEVGTIYIRGMPDATTTWNGRDIFTASGRGFALADIPANLVRRIDVYKTRAASQIETGIAGQVDVDTYRPFDFEGPQLSVQLRGTYLQPRNSIDPNVDVLVSDRWKTGLGEMGALLNVSYVQTRYRDESVTPGALVPFAAQAVTGTTGGWTALERIFPTYNAPDPRSNYGLIWQPGLNAGLPEAAGSALTLNDGTKVPYDLSRDAVFMADLDGKRYRPAVNAAFQWKPNNWSEYTAEVFYDGYRSQTFNSLLFSFVDWWGSLGANPQSTITTYPNTNIIKTRVVNNVYGFNSGDFTDSRTDSYIYALHAKWHFTDRLDVTGDVAYQDSIFKSTFQAMRIDRVAPQINVDFNAGGGYTNIAFANPALLKDASAWNTAQFYDNANENRGSAITGTLDGTYDLSGIGGIFQDVQFGFRYDDRKASEAQRISPNAYRGVPFDTMPKGLQRISSGFFDGRAAVPTGWVVPNGYYVHSHIDEMRTFYGLPTSKSLSVAKTFDIDEKTTTFYLQTDMEHYVFGHKLQAQVGVRYVDVSDDMNFYSGATVTPGHRATSKLLPSATLRYFLTDDFDLRFNYGETLRRPNFVDLNPVRNYVDDVTKIGYGTGTAGNPNLRPTKAKNFDLTAEWFFHKGSAVYATAFLRQIDGLVVSTRSIVNATVPGFTATKYVLTLPENASNGELKGVELGWVYFPDNLPGLLDGLGVQGSVTYLQSTQNIPQTDASGNVIGQQQTGFFGVSDWSYNATLAYDHGNIGGRLSYVWRSPFLYDNEAALFANPIGHWHTAESSLDLQLDYNINKKLLVTFDATNLLNSVQQQYYKFGSAGSPTTTDFGTLLISRTFSIGLHYALN